MMLSKVEVKLDVLLNDDVKIHVKTGSTYQWEHCRCKYNHAGSMNDYITDVH